MSLILLYIDVIDIAIDVVVNKEVKGGSRGPVWSKDSRMA